MEVLEKKDKLVNQDLKISRFKEVIKRTRPHKHEAYYELLFLHQGEGIHFIESDKHLIKAPQVFLLKPGQLHCWQFTAIPKGYVILCKSSWFDPIEDGYLISGLQQLTQHTQLSLKADLYPQWILEGLLHCYNLPESREQILMIKGLMQALIYHLLDKAHKETGAQYFQPGTIQHFQSLLLENIPAVHRVNVYAEKMCTTPQNLNMLCQRKLNRSASTLINEQLLVEAKRYLLHSDNTIEEISLLMNFSSPTQFIRFFKKYETVTPNQYRQMKGI